MKIESLFSLRNRFFFDTKSIFSFESSKISNAFVVEFKLKILFVGIEVGIPDDSKYFEFELFMLGSPMDLPNMSIDQWINGSKSRGVKECLLAFVSKALFIYAKYLSIVEGALYAWKEPPWWKIHRWKVLGPSWVPNSSFRSEFDL